VRRDKERTAMTEQAYVGVELGDLELRAVYIAGSEAHDLHLPLELSGPQILFDPHSETSSLGVGFPMISQKLGANMSFTYVSLRMGEGARSSKVEQALETPELRLTRMFAAIQQSVTKVTGRPVEGVVVAVPATMRQNSRRVLVDCARDAGFGEVSLIDRCTAAALGHRNNYPDRPTTAVVYDLGYGDCEYALLRLAGGRCHVMASGAAPEVSGEALDALVIEATVLALRRKKIYLGLKHFTPFQWHELRQLVADARKTLAERNEAFITLIPNLTGLDKAIKFNYQGEPFKNKLAPLINKTVDGVHGMLEQNALELADIDTILLVGSSAPTSPVYDILSETFGRKAVRAKPNLIAYGAAWHASQLAGNPVELTEAEPDKQLAQFNESPAEAVYTQRPADDDSEAEAGFVMLVDGEEDAHEQSQPKQGPALVITANLTLGLVRKFIEQGRHDEATLLLEVMGKGLEALKAKLQQDKKYDVARTLMQQAVSMVDDGHDPLWAVELTHRAYQQAPDDPQVFEGMLRVHAQASLHMGSLEEYETSIKLLLCALSHDQTNRSIRQALAERYYSHAVVMRKLNKTKAFEMVDQALAYDAKHSGLNQLHNELAAELSNPKSLEETAESN
jgi:actin-like ATPase involved in cell morphogenesis